MGWTEASITIKGVRSSHNSLNDRIDQVKWEWIAERIKDLFEDTKEFESLRIDVQTGFDWRV